MYVTCQSTKLGAKVLVDKCHVPAVIKSNKGKKNKEKSTIYHFVHFQVIIATNHNIENLCHRAN